MTTQTKPHVLLACGSDWQAPVRLPRLFRRAGCQVTVLASPDHGITKTKFIDEVVCAPITLPEYVEALRSHLLSKARKYQWIVAVDDPLLEALVARGDEAWTDAVLPLSRASGLRGALASKAGFAILAANLSLPTPRSGICHSLSQGLVLAESLGYPVVVKLSASYAGMGVRKVKDRHELAAAWSELRAERNVVLQRFVEGKLGNTAALFSEGRLLASMSAFKSRTWPGPFGPSSARQFVCDDRIDRLLESFGEKSGYDGFCAFDWIADTNGELDTIELNARPVPGLHMATHVGVDFSEAISEFLEARTSSEPFVPRMQRSAATRNEAVFPMFPEDFQRAIVEQDDAALARFLPGELGYDDVPWDDPPFLQHVLRRRAMRRTFERIFSRTSSGADAIPKRSPHIVQG